jgi:uncharacterized repeat protein (TIGR03803 family)
MNLNCPQPATRVLIWLIVLATASIASASWKEKVLYSFQGRPDGTEPVGGVIFGKDGNLYGATYGGGQGIGTVFQLLKNGNTWTETVLYSFEGKTNNDGDIATGGLVSDKAGNLYGVTAYGGSGNCVLLGGDVGCGIVYQMTPPATPGGSWTETVIYSFQGGNDGYLPQGDLTFDPAGNLYGATEFGGGFGTTCNPFYQYCGTVFELSPPKQKGGHWIEKVLYSFKGGTDGANPNGGLVFDQYGALYGTTYWGGDPKCSIQGEGVGCGIVFKLKPPTKKGGAWRESVLYRFKAGPNDGNSPSASLVWDKKGVLYGTTVGGGNNEEGTIFRLVPPARQGRSWQETLLHSFNFGKQNGVEPLAGMTVDKEGNLYGTASGGGTSGGGIVFQLRPSAEGSHWAYSVLYNFTGNPDGFYPAAPLIFDSAGTLFSTTQYGGTGQGTQKCSSYGCGTVFQVKP